jgi:hypothetical protein
MAGSSRFGERALKVAVTLRSAVIETAQVPVPVQAPLQAPKVEPAPATAVSVTVVPCENVALQFEPQLKPDGEEATDPVPAPSFATLSAWAAAGAALKVAVTLRSAVIDTVQLPVPEQAPPQPPKVDPPSASAVSVTVVRSVNVALQFEPQLTPAGEELTAPVPGPSFATLRV